MSYHTSICPSKQLACDIIIPAQTIIIEGSKITTVEAARKVKLLQGATLINGTVKYLTPVLPMPDIR